MIPLLKFSYSQEILKEQRIGKKFYYLLCSVGFLMISLNIYTLGSGIDWNFSNTSAYFFLLITILYFILIALVMKEDISISHDFQSVSTNDEKLFIEKEVYE